MNYFHAALTVVALVGLWRFVATRRVVVSRHGRVLFDSKGATLP